MASKTPRTQSRRIITKTLELAYTRWSALTEEIEQVKAKHGL